ncbi:thiamine-phosphate kinase [Frateuria aurantia]|uniref:Thiamine-monophosphate kinase n=1 Tax=Frateuria aurantia (strain ATCC 33424 / DSM 6220 / KCTC 2777 / LMG 1558 / NBRC 3245 / NCIMB 13370) TaxID=767434 RepID=H8L4B0_FRAAD|nr:thiamine-phosphate kinase [Frateuria aurantia]AFC84943.1 thiamine-monophosphate kinase [Frateuria aurantia DSM 6220]
MEFSLIDRISGFTYQRRDDVLLGIGDDAALLQVPAGQSLVVAVDTMVEGVHFLPGTAPADLGWKALAVNLSDLAAMGAMPAWALLALTLPTGDAAFVDGFAAGFAALARPHRLALVGGDTTGGPLAFSVTVHGFVPPDQALTRDGAREGDLVMVTGSVGEGAGGLACLRKYGVQVQDEGDIGQLVARVRRPRPQLGAGLALRGQATACIDISDGLLADLGHICRRSGVGAELDADRLPLSDALQSVFGAEQACRFGLSGGDDYELCFTVPESRAHAVQGDLARIGCSATPIGRIVRGEGVGVRDAGGQWLDIESAGWDHFAA